MINENLKGGGMLEYKLEWAYPVNPIIESVQPEDVEEEEEEETICTYCNQSESDHTVCSNCEQCSEWCNCVICEDCGAYEEDCECETCDECNEKSYNCNCENSTDRAHELWELPDHLKLSRIAAQFYLLYDLWLDELDDGMLEAFLDDHCPQFQNYTDMVIGGELRHAYGEWEPKTVLNESGPLIEALESDHSPMRSCSRSDAWIEWKEFRELHGIESLRWAKDIYGDHIGTYGGRLWGNICEVLYRFLNGEISRIMFFDTIWGLQHNGGAYFNKIGWSTSNCNEVLNIARTGKIEDLLTYVDSSFKKIYSEARCND